MALENGRQQRHVSFGGLRGMRTATSIRDRAIIWPPATSTTASWFGRSAALPAAPGPAAGRFHFPRSTRCLCADQLYVLAEVNDEIRLLALDAETGNTLWSQQLAVVQHNFSPDALRRSVGVSPSYADGILICPTGTGGVVALDLATHSLRWGYSYSHGQNANGNPPAT